MTKLKVIIWLSIAWVAVSVVLVGFYAGDMLPEGAFQWSFAGGFIAYAVLATLVNNVDFSAFRKTDAKGSRTDEEG